MNSATIEDVFATGGPIAKALPGFEPRAVFALAPFNIAYSALVHANLKWTFGPLKYVLASPVFHRWHHTSEEEGLNKNFAGAFPWIDVLFGTFHMPPKEQPTVFGVAGSSVPESFLRQLVYPFRRSGRRAAEVEG